MNKLIVSLVLDVVLLVYRERLYYNLAVYKRIYLKLQSVV